MYTLFRAVFIIFSTYAKKIKNISQAKQIMPKWRYNETYLKNKF